MVVSFSYFAANKQIIFQTPTALWRHFGSQRMCEEAFNMTCFLSSSSVQCPRPALTSHWRASTTVTRAPGSRWTDCATSTWTARSAMTKATYAVSTPTRRGAAVDEYVQSGKAHVSAAVPALVCGPKRPSREVGQPD